MSETAAVQTADRGDALATEIQKIERFSKHLPKYEVVNLVRDALVEAGFGDQFPNTIAKMQMAERGGSSANGNGNGDSE